MTEIINDHPFALLLILGVIALIIGSFLNVVIYRLPIILERQSLSEEEIIDGESPELSLYLPPSHCPQCKQSLKIRHNVPLISYLFLRGQCGFCGSKISIRYPLVELVTLLLSLAVAVKLGSDWQTAGGLILTWTLIALAVIDFETRLLPDELTLPLLWAGLLFSLTGLFTTPTSAILGAAVGYLVFWGLNQTFFLLTKRQGIGYGDMKLLAALGAWFGWQALPFIILVASLSGLFIALLMMMGKKLARGEQISFGPYLCFAGWLFMLTDAKLF